VGVLASQKKNPAQDRDNLDYFDPDIVVVECAPVQEFVDVLHKADGAHRDIHAGDDGYRERTFVGSHGKTPAQASPGLDRCQLITSGTL
jgi:hypothetical protein